MRADCIRQCCARRLTRVFGRDGFRLEEFLLRLYISGDTASSRNAIESLSRLQECIRLPNLKSETIDVLIYPDLAEQARVVATPMLSLDRPAGQIRLIGDLSDTSKILELLGFDASDEFSK
jgi:circadian clock protein KaiB